MALSRGSLLALAGWIALSFVPAVVGSIPSSRGGYQTLEQPAWAPPGWLFAHVPGWDTATVVHLLARVTHVPVVHFGDLDPNGVRILLHLRRYRPDLRWLVPAFWAERLDGHARPVAWPHDRDTTDAPPLVRDLVRRGLWLEQEMIVLDPRLAASLASGDIQIDELGATATSRRQAAM